MSEFEIRGWDFVPEPMTAADELARLAPLFRTPGWCPEWHRWLREAAAGGRMQSSEVWEPYGRPLYSPGCERDAPRIMGDGGTSTFTIAIAHDATDERRREPEPEPDEERLREIMRINQGGRYDEPRETAERILARLREIGI